jgi:diguanylate cyclase (GGDEF)-like protein/PAS domain S-box-containing protein
MDAFYYKNLLDNLYDAIYCVDLDRKIIFWNKAAEAMTGYTEEEAMGKVSCIQVRMHDKAEGEGECLSACLVEQTLVDGKPREFDCFITNRNGRRIPVSARVSPIQGPDSKVIGAVQIFRDNSARIATQQVIEKLKTLAMLDPLTGLANRRYIEKLVESKADELRRYGLRFGLLFIDIDHFKSINDRYGHDAGDKVLWSVSRCMSSIIRASDILGRWGGEEFIALILNVSHEKLAQVAEKMRQRVADDIVTSNGDSLRVTVSIGGVLAEPSPGVDIDRDKLMRRADELMYESKKTGRNKVIIERLGADPKG